MRLGENVVGTKILNSFYSLPERFKEKHGTKFDYSKIIFEKMLKKVIIICPIHGEFLQTPSDHAKGYGCDKCSREESGRLRSLTNEMFIEKATLKHNGKYDYSIRSFLSTMLMENNIVIHQLNIGNELVINGYDFIEKDAKKRATSLAVIENEINQVNNGQKLLKEVN